MFVEAVRQYLEKRPDEVGAAAFDKEDALAVDFVMAASNLRAAAYGIPMQTWFAAKARPVPASPRSRSMSSLRATPPAATYRMRR